MKTDPQNFYSTQINKYNAVIASLQTKSNSLVIARLVSFLLMPFSIYFFWGNSSIWLPTAIGALAILLFLVRISTDVKTKLSFNKHLVGINENELKAMNGDFSMFENGEEFKNQRHAFTFDFDVFGEKSIFQFLNRASSQNAKIRLAEILEDGTENIIANNESITELENHLDWSQSYRAQGLTHRKNNDGRLDLSNWSDEEVVIPKWVKAISYIFPALMISTLAAYILGAPITDAQLVIAILVSLMPALTLMKSTNFEAQKVGKYNERLRAMNEQIILLNQVNFDSPKLKQIQNDLLHADINAAVALKDLQKYLNRFDTRMNVLVAMMLNSFFCYDLHLMLGIQKWKNKYSQYVNTWENHLVEVEVLICGSNFKFNRNDSVFASINSKNSKEIDIVGLGHPLIPSDVLVRNDYKLDSNIHFTILTGPNMAGKSTFLRSLGVNLMLAKAGFPVIAKEFTFPDRKLYSSMRTADNLSEESSYFHAELVRLRFIVDAIERGESVFIVLDEILKGTNSVDKEKGSAQFLDKLEALGAMGIIATHDLSLTELANKNTHLENQYFDSIIAGDEISFDYTLRRGVVKNMNASFLLKKMGLTTN